MTAAAATAIMNRVRSALMDIRTVALVACGAGVASAVLPMWASTRQLVAASSSGSPYAHWLVPVLILGYFMAVITPLFCFALYRDQGTLRLSESLRSIALVAALAVSAVDAVRLAVWIFSSNGGESTVLAPVKHVWAVPDIPTLLSACSDLTYIVLLFALSRHWDDTSATFAPISSLLRIVSKVAIVVFGICVAFHVGRLVLTPYLHSQLREFAARAGRPVPSLLDLYASVARDLLLQGSLLAAPYIVLKSQKNPPPDITVFDEPASEPPGLLS